MQQTIDILTTATRRPDLYEKTLRSFDPLLSQHNNWRLIMNIDPAGDGSAAEVARIAKKRFSEKYVIQTPETPDFRAAWKWCVSQLQSEFVFWLEDDWELIGEVDFKEMISIMESEPNLATLRLPRWPSVGETFRQWNKKEMRGWNGRFFEIPYEQHHACGYSNNPSLTRRDFIKPILYQLQGEADPEKQISCCNRVCRKWLTLWRYGVFQQPSSPPTVKDIGEAWRRDKRLAKGDKRNFKTWEKQDG